MFMREPTHCTGRPNRIADDVSALEQIEIRPVQVPETVFAGPMLGVGGERIADAGGGAGAILGMKLFLPEADFVRGRRDGE